MKKPYDPNDVSDHQRMILAVVLSLLILLGYQFFFAPEETVPEKASAAQMASAQTATAAPGKEQESLRNAVFEYRDDALKASQRIPIDGARISGSLSLTGARLDDVVLKEHKAVIDRKINVPLLSPGRYEGAFYVESGWLPSGDAALVVPDKNSVWQLAPDSAARLTSDGPAVKMRWDNGSGLVFEREITLDKDYLFHVTQRIRNTSETAVALYPYHLVKRLGLPFDYSGFYILHEGPVGFLDEELEEPSYNDLMKGETFEEKETQGWLGITDKYWMAALLPSPETVFNTRIIGDSGADQFFQTDIVKPAVTIASGQAAEDDIHVYAGAKDFDVMKSYEDEYGFPMLSLGIDFGVLGLISKPFYFIFHLLVDFFSFSEYSVGLAILVMTLIIRALMFPLASRAYMSMAKMKTIAPQMKELQATYKDDKAKLQMEIMELYKREKVNPFGGCWPMLIQVPIFFALYKTFLISVDMRHAQFWGWIEDLSAPDPAIVTNLFGLLPFDPPDMLAIGVWPLLFCLTMVIQHRFYPPPADPTQERVQKFFPYVITFMLARFSAGLVIYWTWSNALGVLQQYYIMKKYSNEDVHFLFGHVDRRKKKGSSSKKKKLKK